MILKNGTRQTLVTLVFVLVAFFSVFLAYEAWSSEIKIIKVISNSMAPRFHRGDLVLVKSIPTNELQVGDIAILPLPDGSGGFYLHRITKIVISDSGSVLVNTKGDANPLVDDWQLEVTSPKIPIHVSQFPTFGIARIFQKS